MGCDGRVSNVKIEIVSPEKPSGEWGGTYEMYQGKLRRQEKLL
jgi:hypothetical protein